jgi:hypothetical protein
MEKIYEDLDRKSLFKKLQDSDILLLEIFWKIIKVLEDNKVSEEDANKMIGG